VRIGPEHRKASPRARRVCAFIISALILVVCAWAALELRPPVVGDGIGSAQVIRASLARDAESVIRADQALQAFMAGEAPAAGVDPAQLDRIIATHEAYHLVDIHTDPGLHAESFLVWYAGLSLRSNAELVLGGLSASDREPRDPGRLPAVAELPNILLKMGFASSYLRLLDPILADPAEGEIAPLRGKLQRIAERNAEHFHATLWSDPERVIDAAKEIDGLP
jgi:hypothetical protein